MKMPKYVIRVAGQSFVVASNTGIATLMKLMEEAVPVDPDLHLSPPEITLRYDEEPSLVAYLQGVRCDKIPRHTVWKRKTKTGEAVIIRPVEKQPKALPAPKPKALPARQALRLKGREQLALGFGELS